VADVVCAAFDEANGLAYFGVNAAPARVVKVGLDALTEIGTTADFGAGEDYTPDCTRDPGDGSLYMGVMGSDSGVVKVAP
jgi:hypothetical protein